MATPTVTSIDAMDVPPLTFTYKTYRLHSGSSSFPFLTGKYAALSLRAVTTDPHCFGVAFSTEGSLSSSDFETRLSRPNANVFICVAHPGNLPPFERNIERGAWVGMITQLGPTPKDEFWLRDPDASEPLDDRLETKWHQTATWIDPDHRQKGIGKQLLDAAIDFASRSTLEPAKQVRIRVFTGPHNVASQTLYRSRGFVTVGLCTIPEAMIANGNSMYPFHGKTDWDENILQLKFGIVMERVEERSSGLIVELQKETE